MSLLHKEETSGEILTVWLCRMNETTTTEGSTSQLTNLRTSIPQTSISTPISNNSIPADKSLYESIEGTSREGNSKAVHTVIQADTGYLGADFDKSKFYVVNVFGNEELVYTMPEKERSNGSLQQV